MALFPHTLVAVVGAGISGLSATASLLKRGVKAQCFEISKPGCAQSAGGSRILRCAYDDPGMVDLARKAVEGWKRWEKEFETSLVDGDGSILVVDDPEKELAHLHGAGVDAVIVEPDHQQDLLPVRARWKKPVILEKSAGTIHAAEAIRCLRAFCGNHIHEHNEVIGLTPREDCVLVTTRRAIWRADRVLVCAGALTPVIADSLGVKVSQVHSVHQRLLVKIKPEYRNIPMPSFRDKTDHRDGVLYTYGLRTLHEDRYAIGLEPTDLERVGGGHPDIVVDHTVSLVRELFPGLESEDAIIDSCVSTALAPPDDSTPWESERLLLYREGLCDFFAGGHLFKFAPALGEVLADAAIGGSVPTVLRPA